MLSPFGAGGPARLIFRSLTSLLSLRRETATSNLPSLLARIALTRFEKSDCPWCLCSIVAAINSSTVAFFTARSLFVL
ncbi:hypothetical protein D3C87_2096310 [compost metagenome]